MVAEWETPDMMAENELVDLNTKISQMEVQRDKEAKLFFKDVLSNEMIFRRTGGTVEGKEQFLKGLKNEYPFKKLTCEDIKVYTVDGIQSRALVALVIVGSPKRKEDIERRFRNIRLFSKDDNTVPKWRLDFWYNYELTSL